MLQKEDPVVLRIALKQSREDLKKSQRKLTQVTLLNDGIVIWNADSYYS